MWKNGLEFKCYLFYFVKILEGLDGVLIVDFGIVLFLCVYFFIFFDSLICDVFYWFKLIVY